MRHTGGVLLVVFCLCFSVSLARACSYAADKSPFATYLEAHTIFYGQALKTGVEVVDGAGLNFTLFDVVEPIKGVDSKTVRVYYKPDLKGYEKGTKGLVVSIEKYTGLPLVDLCVLPFYDIDVPPGKSLYAVHHTILSRLGMILMMVVLFAGMMIYFYIKSHEENVHEGA